MHDFDSAHATVSALIADFEAHRENYMSPTYSEAQARLSFIDKFWTALGWDVSHSVQKNPYEQEVRVEKTVTVGGAQKKADYAFYIAPVFTAPLFYVEAKKPSATLDTPDNCFQLLRYAWNSNCPLSVLHDFEELLVLDCRWRPDVATAQSRIWKRFHYTDFLDPEKFRFLYHLFSREAAADGSLAKRAAELPKPRGKSQQRNLFKLSHARIDEAFLTELEQWREDLAKSFKRDNPDLDSETLTEVTQRTLDRLVFLRFLEDKGIEQRTTVGGLGGASGTPWADFQAASRRLDRIYNGAIFRRHPVLDADSFHVASDAFAGICEELDSRNSVYNFDVIPIHILGSIYERFLGSVIIATAKQARVEQKPEVRKAGGVYYTPEYIVRYIVEQTVGKQIAGKTPEQIESMSFADIACGSGSFLLGVFECLLKYHTLWYNENPSKARLHSEAKYTRKKGKLERAEKAGDCRMDDDSGTLRLTLEKKRQILLNNVFGTDLDPQAVEVAQFSLYLKLLEDETAGTTHQYQLDFEKDALLPSLEKNILCGNALIGWQVSGLLGLDASEQEELRPLDYEDQFPGIFRQGGFDAIVGNPPYVRIQILQESSPTTLSFIKSHYASARRGNCDLYVVFLERALMLTKTTGDIGYIVPNKFMNSEYGSPIRSEISQKKALKSLVHFGEHQVFNGATTYTCLCFLSPKPQKSFRFEKVTDLARWETNQDDCSLVGNIQTQKLTSEPWNLTVGPNSSLLEKLSDSFPKLGDIADIFVGVQTSADQVYVMDKVADKGVSILTRSAILEKNVTLESALLHPILSGTDVSAYNPLVDRQYVIFPYSVADGSANLLKVSEFKKSFPLTWDYLIENKKFLSGRERGKFADTAWYRFGRSQNLAIQNRPKVCVPRLVDRLCCTLDLDGAFFLDNVDVGGVSYKGAYSNMRLEYMAAILNSKLMGWFFPFVSAPFRGGWMSANKQFLSQIPFKLIDKTSPREIQIADKLVTLVDDMVEAKKQDSIAINDVKRDFWTRKAQGLDRQIDTLVYELYGLTPEEIDLVEGNAPAGKEPADD
ncbi:MAG: Eco57I restriction-modification methylase domain-containing protein [Luteolibacter sp.]